MAILTTLYYQKGFRTLNMVGTSAWHMLFGTKRRDFRESRTHFNRSVPGVGAPQGRIVAEWVLVCARPLPDNREDGNYFDLDHTYVGCTREELQDIIDEQSKREGKTKVIGMALIPDSFNRNKPDPDDYTLRKFDQLLPEEEKERHMWEVLEGKQPPGYTTFPELMVLFDNPIVVDKEMKMEKGEKTQNDKEKP